MNDDTKTELVWLPIELAKKLKELNDPTCETALRLINEHIDKTRKNYKDNLELLNEDVVMFQGLLVGVKRQYADALRAQLDSECEIWEDIDKERPRLKEKTQTLVDSLKPLADSLKEIKGLLGDINTWEITKLVEQVAFLSSHLDGKTGEMIRFICTKYKPKITKGQK